MIKSGDIITFIHHRSGKKLTGMVFGFGAASSRVLFGKKQIFDHSYKLNFFYTREDIDTRYKDHIIFDNKDYYTKYYFYVLQKEDKIIENEYINISSLEDIIWNNLIVREFHKNLNNQDLVKTISIVNNWLEKCEE